VFKTQKFLFTYCLVISVGAHGVFFGTLDAYNFLHQSFSEKAYPTIELVSFKRSAKSKVSQDAAKENKIQIKEDEPKKTKAPVRKEEWDERKVQNELARELKEFKTEAKRKMFLTYYKYLSLAIRQKLVYPEKAKNEGIAGSVYLAFSLNQKGELLKLELKQGSGYNVLDEAARLAIRHAAPFAKLPRGLEKKEMKFYVPIHFKKGQ